MFSRKFTEEGEKRWIGSQRLDEKNAFKWVRVELNDVERAITSIPLVVGKLGHPGEKFNLGGPEFPHIFLSD